MVEGLGYIIIVICSFIQFIILKRVSNQLTNEKIKNSFLRKQIEKDTQYIISLEFRNIDLKAENINLKQKLNDESEGD